VGYLAFGPRIDLHAPGRFRFWIESRALGEYPYGFLDFSLIISPSTQNLPSHECGWSSGAAVPGLSRL